MFLNIHGKTPAHEPVLVFSWQLSEIFNNDIFNTFKISIFIRNVDQTSITNLITQRFTLNFSKISVFQVVKTSYIRSCQLKQSLKVVNNTLTIGFWSLTCQNSHAGISQLILMTDLINIHVLLPENASFLECSNGPTSILSNISVTLWKSHETIFVGYF